jgi:hypothetical protein
MAAVLLVWGARRHPSEPPIPIEPAAPATAAAATGAARASDPKKEGAEAEPASESPPSTAKGLPGDGPAAAGYAFIRIDKTRLLRNPQASAEVLERLPSGQSVRRYDEVAGYALVLVPPSGPAGFVEGQALGRFRPIAALARDLGIAERCKAAASPDACRQVGQKELDSCLIACGTPTPDVRHAQDGDLGARCVQACQMAYDDCATGCPQVRGAKSRPAAAAAGATTKPKRASKPH